MLNFGVVCMLVLDEVDCMFDMGFEEFICEIVGCIYKDC